MTIDKLTLAGNDADNYTATTVGATTADIEPATLSATATAASKIYDGTTAAAVTIALSGLLSGDVVVGSATGTFDDESVGNGKPTRQG